MHPRAEALEEAADLLDEKIKLATHSCPERDVALKGVAEFLRERAQYLRAYKWVPIPNSKRCLRGCGQGMVLEEDFDLSSGVLTRHRYRCQDCDRYEDPV
jgi:hypothetical protein